MSNSHYLLGHCACGSVRYAIDVTPGSSASPHLSAFCHCSRCQRFNGSPYIWTSHWDRAQVTWYPPGGDALPGDDKAKEAGFSPSIQAFEAMQARKWKLRCRECGSPMGSWNAARQRWTVYLPSLLRIPSATQAPTTAWTHNEGVLSGPLAPSVLGLQDAQGLLSSLPTLPLSSTSPTLVAQDGGRYWALVRPTHHQFYGTADRWGLPFDRPSEGGRGDDGLEKWDGYKDQSNRVG